LEHVINSEVHWKSDFGEINFLYITKVYQVRVNWRKLTSGSNNVNVVEEVDCPASGSEETPKDQNVLIRRRRRKGR